MSDSNNTTIRWRPKLSIRILLILVTFICAYLACWGPTENRGTEDVFVQAEEYLIEYEAVAPLLVRSVCCDNSSGRRQKLYRHYYFWFFGYVARSDF